MSDPDLTAHPGPAAPGPGPTQSVSHWPWKATLRCSGSVWRGSCRGATAPLRSISPPIRSALDVALGSAQVASLVADGQLTPQEGRDVSVLFETQRRAIETALLEKSRVGLDPDPPEA